MKDHLPEQASSMGESNLAPQDSTSRRRRPRRVMLIALTIAVVLAVATGTLAIVSANGRSPHSTTKTAPPVATTKVTVQDLVETKNFDGTLAFGPSTAVKGGAGVVTALPTVGAILDRGTVAFRANDLPVAVFIGPIPLFRPLDRYGLTGADVLLVASNLRAAGFYQGEVSADPASAEWTWSLIRAVKEWQSSLGLPRTGVINPGDVVVLAGPSRVNDVKAALGDSAASPIFTVTGTAKAVSLHVKATDANKLALDQAVTVLLPDGTEVPAKVTAVGTVLQQPSDNNGADSPPTLTFTVTPESQDDVADLDFAAVSVRVVIASREHVLAVPIEALLSLAEGGYALQKVDGTLIAVTLGMFSNDLVEVTGRGLSAGMKVVTAS